ncbi:MULTISPECIES: ATP-grasp domain-containing protein [Leptospira]|uniref:Biotin carboxylase n=2 Tax=Leptospira santarosai TaxID=28183 RepID=K8XV92_9LEPT|nr:MULTISPECIES: ATP-grasp domain-containing protein [Leptospira]AVV49011.1 Biotin carboxylase [Leptospira santarosai]EKO76804.1 ATP-grasp domain protein [Leptospira sp. Fiocruz LV3954]EKT85334.1 biotin carboxylase [Leptospira santarosai serovar Shermani str. LT 821]EMI61472.1 ATP-grasp domain protein [Leptospira sp. Fiocruz LV4135]EMJ48610.1 ATP-grasp domain protein [Leptospira santarosai str. HAI1349]
MKEKGYFLSIGAGLNQVPLISAAIKLGYSVISVDRNNHAPGLSVSSLRIMESVTEYRKILKTVSEIPLQGKILGIGTRSYGKATYTASYIADKLKLRYASLESVEICSDKNLLKETAKKIGILTPEKYDTNALIAKNQFPFVYKPSRGSGKEGIRTFHDPKEWESFLKSKQKKSRSKVSKKKETADQEEWIAEEYVPGFEITVCGLIQDGKFFPASISHKDVTNYAPYLEIAHTLPFLRPELIGEILLNCRALIAATKMNNCPFVSEFRINPQGEIYLIEAAPEVGGEFLADALIPNYFGSLYFENLVKLLTGEKIKSFPNYSEVPKKYAGIFFSAPPEGKSKLIEHSEFSTMGKEKLMFDRKLKQHGEILKTTEGNGVRVRSIGIVGPEQNRQTLEEWKKSVLQRLEGKFESV